MAAYATQKRESSARRDSSSSNRLELALSQPISGQTASRTRGAAGAVLAEPSILDQLLDHIADRLAAVITDRLVVSENRPDEWFDSRHAAEYLGVHRDTIGSWRLSERFLPSRMGLAASCTSGALTSRRGETAAGGLVISQRRWPRWREQWLRQVTTAPLRAVCAWSEISTAGHRAYTRSASRMEPVGSGGALSTVGSLLPVPFGTSCWSAGPAATASHPTLGYASATPRHSGWLGRSWISGPRRRPVIGMPWSST
jgi:hypothetical protein